MKLPLVVTPDNGLPLYLQLQYQLTYLITSEQLPDNYKLPPVHKLAEELGINPGTIVRAYKELQTAGLIHSIQGKGTFVKWKATEQGKDRKIRQDLLIQALEHARRRAFALGFEDLEIDQWMKTVLGASECDREIAFVSYASVPTAHKYAKVIERSFNDQNMKVKVKASTLEQLNQKKESLFELLDPAYYIITLINLVHQVEEALEASPHGWQVVGVSMEITPQSIDQLIALPPHTKACLVLPERSLYQTLSLVEQHSQLDSGSLPFAFVANPDIVERVTHEAEVVIHTYGAHEILEQLNVPPSKRLEIDYQITLESLEKLAKLFNSRI